MLLAPVRCSLLWLAGQNDKLGDENIHDNFMEATIGRGEAWSVCESILGLCSTKERKEPDTCLHVPRTAIVFCKTVLVFRRSV